MTIESTSPVVAWAPRQPNKVSFVGALKSEVIKLYTVRSTVWAFAVVFMVAVGFSTVFSIFSVTLDTGNDPISGSPMDAAARLWGVIQAPSGLTAVAVLVLGTIVITGEYGTGLIRSTLTAVPKRIPALLAKAVAIAVVTFVFSWVSLFIDLIIQALILGSKFAGTPIVTGELLVNISILSLGLALLAVIAVGIGTVLRNTALCVTILVLTMLVLGTLISLIPGGVGPALSSKLFGQAFQGMTQPGPSSLLPTLSDFLNNLLILGVWVAVALVAASVLIKTRDA